MPPPGEAMFVVSVCAQFCLTIKKYDVETTICATCVFTPLQRIRKLAVPLSRCEWVATA